MTKYLLDTNVLIAMFRGQYGIRECILEAGFENCFVSEITLGEIITGAYKGDIAKHQHEIDFLKEQFTILPVSPAIEYYGKLRSSLEKQGTPVDSLDLLIAATALESNLTLVTHNTKHFQRIPGLKVVDWEA